MNLLFILGNANSSEQYFRPPTLLAASALIVTTLLLARYWTQSSDTRKNMKSDVFAAIASAVAFALALVWLFAGGDNPFGALASVVGIACVLAAACVLFLPADFSEHQLEPNDRDGEPGLKKDAESARELISYLETQGRIAVKDEPDRLGQDQLKEVLLAVQKIEIATRSDPPKAIEVSDETEFYRLFGLLISKARPVSVESLKHCRPNSQRNQRRSLVAMELELNGRFMLVAVFLLVIVQAFTAIGLTLHNEVRERQQIYLKFFDPGIGKAGNESLRPGEFGPAMPLGVKEASNLGPQIRIARAEMNEAYASLEAWVSPIFKALNVLNSHDGTRKLEQKLQGDQKPPDIQPALPETEPKLADDFAKTRIEAKLLLDFLSTYLLPLLYGWAGSMVYIVRRLSGEMSSLTFLPGNLAVRAWLGLVAGLAIGWFYPATTTTNTQTVPNLGPLALAFLAGFGVEILFSALDRFVKAFTDPRTLDGPK